MRAAVQTGLRTIEMRDVATPAASDEHALVRVRACGVCGSDLHPYVFPRSLPLNPLQTRGTGLQIPHEYRPEFADSGRAHAPGGR